MKKLLFFIVLFVFTYSNAQNGFHYKILLGENGVVLNNQNVTVRIGITDLTNNPVYSEYHDVTTDANGIAQMVIGYGYSQAGDFSSIDWSQSYRLHTEIDQGGGNWQDMGYQIFQYMPYAKYADKAGNTFSGNFDDLSGIPPGLSDGDDVDDADNDPTNEYQTLSISGNDLSISHGNTVTLPSGVQAIDDLNDGKTGGFSVFLGSGAGNAEDGNSRKNTALGFEALNVNISGHSNVALGFRSLYQNTADYNTAIGSGALYSNTNGGNNTALGDEALYHNTSGQYNTGAGYGALFYTTTSRSNTAMGAFSLFFNTSGNYNTATGHGALYLNETGDYNTALGFQAYFNADDLNNTTCIGYGAGRVSNASNRIEIGNTSVTWIGGQVTWSTYSDSRIKKDIAEDVAGLDFILRLRPVTYHLDIHRQNEMIRRGKKYDEGDWPEKYDIENIKMSGFIAQEVEQAAKEAGYDFSGVQKATDNLGIYSLSYAQFTVPLVKAVQEQQEEIRLLKQNLGLQQKIIQQLMDQNGKLKNKILELENKIKQLTNTSPSSF